MLSILFVTISLFVSITHGLDQNELIDSNVPIKCNAINRTNTDPDQYIMDGYRRQITESLDKLSNHKIKCGDHDRPYQLALVIVSKIWFDDKVKTIEQCGEIIFNNLGVGYKPCNNGVLILVSVLDRKVTILAGAGSKRQYPVSDRDQVINGMKPYLREMNYGEAMAYSVSESVGYLTGDKEISYGALYMVIGVLGGVSALILVIASCENPYFWTKLCYRLTACCKYRDTRKKVKKLIKLGKATKRDDQVVFNDDCAICLESMDLSDGIMETPCNHFYHSKCINRWLNNPNSKACPLCRERCGVHSLKHVIDRNLVNQSIDHNNAGYVMQNFIESRNDRERRYLTTVWKSDINNSYSSNQLFNDLWMYQMWGTTSSGTNYGSTHNYSSHHTSSYHVQDFGGGGFGGGDFASGDW